MALLQARARARALARLVELFPLTYESFYAEELAKEGLSPRQPRRHGTRSCYQAGCRRQECRDANTEYERQRRRAS